MAALGGSRKVLRISQIDNERQIDEIEMHVGGEWRTRMQS
jgi:hypothetical protein